MRSIMVFLEPHEWRAVIEGLMELRLDRLAKASVPEDDWKKHGEDPEIEELMWNIMTHAGLPDARRVVPEAYALCSPEQPPRIMGKYGKYM